MTAGVPTTDALLDRIERRALILTAAVTILAALFPGRRLWNAAAVAGGALLAMVSFWAIRRGITGLAHALVAAVTPTPRSTRLRMLPLFVLRYALLAGMAYVMIARLRLPPLGLLCGASVTLLAAAAELIRRSRPS
jgi:hypothetical protein